jgi:hypothetical protein
MSGCRPKEADRAMSDTHARFLARGRFGARATRLAWLVALCACADGEARDDAAGIEPPPVVLAQGSALSLATFRDPPARFRPMTRWWWPGNDVEPDELRREVEVLADAFFGGVEIQALDGSLDPDADAATLARRFGYDGERFYANVRTVMERAREYELRVDLTLGSGWPLAGKRYGPADSMRRLEWAEWRVEGPGLQVVALAPAPTALDAFHDLARGSWPLGRFVADDANRIAVMALRVKGGARSDSATVLTDTVDLDPASLRRLDDLVDADGTLRWDAPNGAWDILAFFDGPDGSCPADVAEAGSDGAAGPERLCDLWVADHLDADLVQRELEHFYGERTGLAPFYGDPFGSIFIDSFEFKTDRHWADGFLEEFERRRGYDLTPWLPAVLLPGADSIVPESIRLARRPEFALGADDARVRYDYAHTVSDLFVDRLLAPAARWADDRGLALRTQAYGADIDVIAASGAAHVPEVETIWAGGTEMLLRFVASAAHQHRRPLVSCESLAGDGYAETPTKLKLAIDKLLGSGVNQVIYHGFPYVHDGDAYGETPWMPFHSRYPRRGTRGTTGGLVLGERWTYWDALPDLNRYVARAQYLMRQGEPEVDVLVYYPWFGFPNSIRNQPEHEEILLNMLLPEPIEPPRPDPPSWELVSALFETEVDERVLWLERLWPVLEALAARGIQWGWTADAGIAEAVAEGDAYAIGGQRFRAIVVFEAPAMRPEAADHLAELIEAGLPMVTLGDRPEVQPGYFDRAARDAKVRDAWARIVASDHHAAARDGESVAEALGALGVEAPVALEDASGGMRGVRRRLENGARIVFLRNATLEAEHATLRIAGGCEDGYVLDAWTGGVARAPVGAGGGLEVALDPGESAFVVCGDGALEGESDVPEWARRLCADADAIALAKWTLRVDEDGVESGGVVRDLDALEDWRAIDALAHARGPGTYTTTARVEGMRRGERFELDLGWIQGDARVRVNGESAGTASVAPFRWDVTDLVREGGNEIEVEVTPPMRNWLIALGNGGDPLYDNYRGLDDSSVATGMLGPARLLRGAAVRAGAESSLHLGCGSAR